MWFVIMKIQKELGFAFEFARLASIFLSSSFMYNETAYNCLHGPIYPNIKICSEIYLRTHNKGTRFCIYKITWNTQTMEIRQALTLIGNSHYHHHHISRSTSTGGYRPPPSIATATGYKLLASSGFPRFSPSHRPTLQEVYPRCASRYAVATLELYDPIGNRKIQQLFYIGNTGTRPPVK